MPAPKRTRAMASPLFTPRKASPGQQRSARKEFAAARLRARRADQPAARRTRPAADPDLRATYPPAGRPGPASARGGELALPAHRMTTAVAAGAYPFLAEGGLGAQGIYIGRDVHAEAAFCYDPFSLYGRLEGFTNPNLLLAGIIGMGKSALAKSLAPRAIAFGYRIYVPCDPKGEWTLVTLALGGNTIALGPGLPGRLNPLDAPARPEAVSPSDWAGEVRKRRLLLLASLTRTVLKRDLLPMEHTALDVALDTVVTTAQAAGSTPLLGEITHVLNSPHRLDAALGEQGGRLGLAAEDLAHALRRLVHGDLAGMFDAPSTTAFDPTAPMLSTDLSRLGGAGDDTALVLATTCASAWMESALADPGGGRRWVIYDEAWRVMRHLALLERMQAQWKLSRGLGIANLMVIHRLSDLLTAGDAGSRGRALAEGLLADCSTRIIYRQEADQLSRHPGLGVTATNPRHLPVIDLLLHRVGFTHLPDQGLYALTDPAREPTRRTQQALRALRGTALTVTAPDFDAAPPQPTPASASHYFRSPDAMFRLHAVLRVVAATREDQPRTGQILTEYGFRHLPRLNLHTLPPGTEPFDAASIVATASRVLQDAGVSVAADPATTLSPDHRQSPPPTHQGDNATQTLRDLTGRLHRADRGVQVAEAIGAVLDAGSVTFVSCWALTWPFGDCWR